MLHERVGAVFESRWTGDMLGTVGFEPRRKAMMRWMMVFGCVFALALSAPMGGEATAAKRGKVCTSKGMDGKQTKWSCKATEKCCFDWLASKGTCVAASAVCM
jgi:hypothetical protein